MFPSLTDSVLFYCFSLLLYIDSHPCSFHSVFTFFSPLLFACPSFHIFSLRFFPLLLFIPLICISFPSSSPFSCLGIHCLPVSSSHCSGSLSLFSIHIWIPCLPRHRIPCLLWHFCLFLCICLTSYSLLMYLSHFPKQCCQSFPREADWTALIETMANLINHWGNQSWGEPPISSPLISSALICSPSREQEEKKTREKRYVWYVCVCVLACFGGRG